MDRKSLVFWGFLLFFIFIGIAYAWWTPTDSINLRCRYEIMNVTNITFCEGGSITGNFSVDGNINVTKHNITDVDWVFVNNLTKDSGGVAIWIHSNIIMEYPYNITANNFIGNATYQQMDAQYWRNSTGNVVWCKYYNGTHLIEESPCMA